MTIIEDSAETIDLSTYDIAVYSEGQDGSGMIEVEVTSIPYYDGYDEDIENLLWYPKINVSKSDNLSNGDVVTVTIELDQYELDRLGIDTIGTYQKEVKINKLDDSYMSSSSRDTSASHQTVLPNTIFTTISATSYLSEQNINMYHRPQNIVDGDEGTAWVEGANGQGLGESLTLTLDGTYSISKFAVYNGYQGKDEWYYNNSRPSKIRLTFSDNSQEDFYLDDQKGEQTLELQNVVKTSSVSITILDIYKGDKYEDTAISEFRLIGQKSMDSVSTSVSNQQIWPISKQEELAQYMVKFGNEMNQPNYQRIAITKPLIWLGRELSDDFKIVDGYEYWYDNNQKVHRYIFTINDTGEPIVLYSSDVGNPEKYTVKLTQNEMLPVAFQDIFY